ncbi:hypothetical protein A3K93_12250 [Acinetobacter sp. NCu2D-2]|uniref:EpsG family protein n=1 Tax=Acinetobacter sp. NCu2D-2 TaxID=1608473 RepID=UPI0007CE0497|nr:hypothetical protein A3K93_12250 [Acinetobacter sp. NCu2D-2]
MILFFGIYFAVIGLYVLSNLFNNKVVDKFIVLIISLILSILPGFRALHIGTDTYMYDSILYSDLSEGSYFVTNIEPGYIFLVNIFQIFSIEPYFFYVVSFFANLLIVSTIFNLKKNRFLALLSYLTFSQIFLIGFNILRQYLALSIFIYSVNFLFEKKYLNYIIFVLIATSIHYSSIFFIFFIPLFILIFNKYIISAYMLAFTFPFIYNFVQKNLIFILSNFTGKVAIENYVGRGQESGAGIWYIFYLLVLIYFIILRNKNSYEYYFFVCSYILLLGFYTNISFFNLAYEGPGRLIVCCYFSLIFIFSYLKYGKYVVLHYLIFIFLFLFFFFYNFWIKGLHRILPYESIF